MDNVAMMQVELFSFRYFGHFHFLFYFNFLQLFLFSSLLSFVIWSSSCSSANQQVYLIVSFRNARKEHKIQISITREKRKTFRICGFWKRTEIYFVCNGRLKSARDIDKANIYFVYRMSNCLLTYFQMN